MSVTRNDYRSKCCEARVRQYWVSDNPVDLADSRVQFVCGACDQACDVEPVNHRSRIQNRRRACVKGRR